MTSPSLQIIQGDALTQLATLPDAIQLGRSSIGIELNPNYCDIARQRCNVTPGLPFQ